ncbi:Flagellar basal body-associated protein FliL [Verrucomicrobium sp. GAS474]|nr:Flagellar basal body-associated protein FliL [Verrucomicrobium sp. GAS474]
MVVAIAVAVIMLAAGFAMVYFILPGRLADELAKKMPAADASEGGDSHGAEAAAPAEGAKGEAKAGEGKEGATGAPGAGFTLSDILVNVTGTGGSRFIKVSVYFQAPMNVQTELQGMRDQLKDIVSNTLAQKSLAELSDSGVRGRLRSELLATINPLLKSKGEVQNIYFPEFIIQ